MRTGLTVLGAMLTLFVASAAPAQQADSAVGPADKGAAGAKPAVEMDKTAPARLRAQMHRTMAALIEAQSADEPDPAKIKNLQERLQALRAKMWAQAPRGWNGQPPAWQPGAGRGPGWGRGPGQGRGPGYGWGRGPGYGRGSGWGRGPGYGPVPGAGPGPGAGRGPGYGRGYGRGLGRGWGFVDENGNGICDNFEAIQGQK